MENDEAKRRDGERSISDVSKVLCPSCLEIWIITYCFAVNTGESYGGEDPRLRLLQDPLHPVSLFTISTNLKKKKKKRSD